jgi:hypothetical protein
MMLFWNPLIFSSTGYYLMAVADLMDAVTTLTEAPASAAERRRSQFKVIHGGKGGATVNRYALTWTS